MFRHFWCFRHKTAQPWTCASSTTPPAEQRACAGALAAAARLHRLHHEVSELFDWIIVALAGVVLYDACKKYIYLFISGFRLTTMRLSRRFRVGGLLFGRRMAAHAGRHCPGRGLLRQPRLHGAARRWAPFTVEGQFWESSQDTRHNLAFFGVWRFFVI